MRQKKRVLQLLIPVFSWLLCLIVMSCSNDAENNLSSLDSDIGEDAGSNHQTTDGDRDADSVIEPSESTAFPLKYYGIWARGDNDYFDPSDPNFDYILSMANKPQWSDIQPDSPNEFEWKEQQEAIQLAYDRDLLIYFAINVGPQSPDWIYEQGVPEVNTVNHRFSRFPYYLDPDYISYYHNLIKEFGKFIRTQPVHLLERVAFVQINTGATGDEAAYKGELTGSDAQYAISGDEWRNFRLQAFEQFRLAFISGDARSIPLLFNRVNPGMTEWDWVNENIGGNFGIKSGGSTRAHHLTGSRNDVEMWHPLCVNPSGAALFSRSEMDQTWQMMPLFQINIDLGFYWATINSLNQGLSVWDITGSALTQAEKNPSIQDSFRFFNRYAGQIFPETATKAFIVLHDGLDSSDTVRFPEQDYGSANKGNVSRYEAICNDPVYAARGARMDDPSAATTGQVSQRHNQSGYNDAGWEIWPGNYSRFITQLAPNRESIGVFRVVNGTVGGNINENSPIYSRFARSFESSTGKDIMRFKLEEGMIRSALSQTTFTVIYYDNNAGSEWSFAYDAGAENFKTAFTITNAGTNEWKTKVITVTDAILRGNGPGGCDFALVNEDTLDDIFHLIEVEIEK